MRHGSGRRRVPPGPAPRRILARTGIDGLASGHCRPFDVRADGAIFGSGVGVVVLKPLQDAVDDGDRIHAVIRGSAINNDGSTKMNYAAPNAAGQAEVIAEAHAVADIDASTVSYVETHGTGTPLGDPIEIEGLRQAFDVSTAARPGPCVLGSVKSNIGHLEVASGIAGLIKTILCLKHRAIPGTLHFTSPNPELHLDRGPFVVRSEYGPWEWDGVRRAGVSSFGVGGTNAMLSSKKRRRFRRLTSNLALRCSCCRPELPRPWQSHAPPLPPSCPARRAEPV